MIVSQLKSQPQFVIIAVSRGSVLGPLIFLFDIDELTSMFESPHVIYAAYTKIWCTIQSSDTKHILQVDLDKLTHWSVICDP